LEVALEVVCVGDKIDKRQWKLEHDRGHAVYKYLTTADLPTLATYTNLIWNKEVSLEVSFFVWCLLWNHT
jgi:hypothetical protein